MSDATDDPSRALFEALLEPPEPPAGERPAAPADDEMRFWGPDRAEGVRKYVEKMGYGCGVAYGYSKRFIETFGPDKLPEIISKNPRELLSVARNFDHHAFSAKWNQKRPEERVAMMAMLSYRNISYADAVKIFAKYGPEKAAATVKDDPYQLSLDIDGIGFERADKIAEEGGTGRTSPKRLRAALFHALRMATDEGDCFVSRRDWLGKAEWLIGRGLGKQFAGAIEQLISEGHVYEVLLPGSDRRVYYPRSHYHHEARLARRLREISSTVVQPVNDFEQSIAGYEQASSVQLSPEQRDAVQRASESPLSVITGGPGTGKTTVVRAIVNLFEGAGLTVSLAAFAGCAAKRLREQAGAQALTIHRTLAFDPPTERFAKDAFDPLESDVLVLDETSMIDVALLDHAAQAVRPGARLILVGDVDQLPSIGPGAVLRDVILSGIAPVTRLETIFRQSQRSRIVTGSRRIKRGLRPVPAAVVDQEMRVLARLEDPDVSANASDEEPLRDYVDVEVRRPPDLPACDLFDAGEAAAATVVRLVTEIEKRYGIPAREVQVLSPMRVRSGGADALNKSLQAALNPLKPPVPGKKPDLQVGSNPRETVSPGDKVMQVRNDYNKGLYNGDIGHIVAISPSEAFVDFHDGVAPRRYTPGDASDLKLAYASTIHKSQGSEYPCVVLVILSHQAHMFSRNGRSLFYTAVTRGKKLVFVVHDSGAIDKALGEPYPRQTLLKERLQGVPIRFRSGNPKEKPTS